MQREHWKIAWCHSGAIGGSSRTSQAMVQELVERGHAVDEWLIGPERASITSLGARCNKQFRMVIETPGRRKLRPYLLHTYGQLIAFWRQREMADNAFERVARRINDHGYDVVHVAQFLFSESAGLLPFLRLPTVVYSHGVAGLWNLGSWVTGHHQNGTLVRRWYTNTCEQAVRWRETTKIADEVNRIRHAGLVLTNSRFSCEAFFHLYGRMPVVCYPGVDTQRFRPLGLPIQPMVLSVGRIHTQKQHHLLIEAAALIEPARRPRVVIATPENGKPLALEGDLAALAKQRHVELTVVHEASEEELVELYNQALALVFVPIMEPFGIVLLEAMACGTPVIGVNEGGMREVVLDGETGFLVEREATDIAAVVRRIQREPGLRDHLSRHAVSQIQSKWTWDHTIDRYEQTIEQFLETDDKFDPRLPTACVVV